MPKMPAPGWKYCVRVLEKLGFTFDRTSNSRHLAYWKKGLHRPVIVPQYDNPPPFIIINNILRTGKISRDKYIAILTKQDD